MSKHGMRSPTISKAQIFKYMFDNNKLISKSGESFSPPLQNKIVNYFTPYISSIVTARSSLLSFSTALFLMFLEKHTQQINKDVMYLLPSVITFIIKDYI